MADVLVSKIYFDPDKGKISCDEKQIVDFVNQLINERDFYFKMLKKFSDLSVELGHETAKFTGQNVTFMRDDQGGGFIKIDPPEDKK